MTTRRGAPHRARPPLAGAALLLLLAGGSGARATAQGLPRWDGYIQLRYTRTSAADSGFSIRRAKLWVTGPLDRSFVYKVQARFANPLSGALMLQDAWLGYRTHGLLLQGGQLVPAFSLQRSQPDYVIPVVERAQAVNALIPTAETGARDVGLQAALPLARGHVRTFAGLFDGTGANQVQTRLHDYLFTQRSTASAALGHGLVGELGYSLAYRDDRGLPFKPVFRDTVPFTGRDFRWGLDASLAHPRWQLQAEYIQADLGDARAWGWYALAAYDVTHADQLVALVDRYRDLGPEPADRPWWEAGWNHGLADGRARLMLAARARFEPDATPYEAVAQFRLMFR